MVSMDMLLLVTATAMRKAYISMQSLIAIRLHDIYMAA